MRKIILSVAVAAMALSTAASALEDIKVNGQAKLWYETNDKASNSLFNRDGASGEVVFKLGMTGKQGNVGFGTTIYQTSSMGLEGNAINAYRTDVTNGDMFVGEAYVTAPMGSMTSLKLGKQELNTPYLFTETWNALPNTFNAAVVTVKPVADLSLVAMYVGQDSTDNGAYPNAKWKSDGNVDEPLFGGSEVFGALYKSSAFDVNAWYTHISNALGTNTGAAATGYTGGTKVNTYWIDAGTKIADINLRAYATMFDADILPDTTKAFALSAGTKVGDFDLFAAGSTVSKKGDHDVANISTGGKKSSLPTEGVYTDGMYVAQNDSTAVKLKVSTKVGSTGIALQGVNNTSDKVNTTGYSDYVNGAKSYETTEFDLFLTDKFGDFSTTAILMHRSFKDDATDDKAGGFYARFIVALNF
ncbi:MAG: hypothetical protein PHO62_02965 [Sulfurimonas sp.]|uniref:hypothetical protein n=1 Tax=Sulfurimonas sp. TaxID=2022749 RepID=UPI00260530EB|nr:hypothetical protein [Sulfurimonas sp.]MDD5372370.1 hypothetical protein [Sulfurimonas sp.]